MKVLDNLTGNIFLAASRDYELLLSYRNIALHTCAESRRSSHNYVESPSSSTATHVQLPP